MAGTTHSYGDIAWSGNLLSRVDPRVKLAWIAVLLTANLVASSYAVSLVIAVTMVLLMILGRVPYRRQLVAISFPVSFALFAVVSQTVFAGGSIYASIGPVDLHSDGFVYGLYISLRIVAGGLVVVLLGVTTPINQLCLALRWFRMPLVFVEVLQLAYRYLFDIYAEFFRMKEAQRARLGWSSARRGVASSRMLGGALFLRVYERGLRSSEAMRSRGSGSLLTGTLPGPSRLDAAAVLALAALIPALVLLAAIEPSI